MSISHQEFFRTLPRLLGGRPVAQEDSTIEIADGAKHLAITLAPETKRRVGAMQLPSTRVDFRFHGYTESEVRVFIADFDLHFRRGGG